MLEDTHRCYLAVTSREILVILGYYLQHFEYSRYPVLIFLLLQTQMFAQTTREMPEWMTVFKTFANLKCSSFLFVAWFMGFGIGLIFTFLFWHLQVKQTYGCKIKETKAWLIHVNQFLLQEYGGSPTLFGFASIINHISEILAYFWSFKLIRHYGHVKVLTFQAINWVTLKLGLQNWQY